MSLPARSHDHCLVWIFENTLFLIYPRLLLGLENVSHSVRNPLPFVFREGGDVALAQRASDDTLRRYGKDIFPRNFLRSAEEFLV